MSGAIRRESVHAEGLKKLRRTVRIRLRRQAADLAHDHSHVERVHANAERIASHLVEAEGGEIDGDALEAACLLHETGRGAIARGESIVDGTLRTAEEMLRADGLGDLVWPVCEALAEHLTPGRDPTTPIGRALNDADVLEELGAIGLARLIATAAAQATPLLYDPDDPEARERPLDDGTYVLDRLPAHHFNLPASCTTEWGREEAQRRARVLAAYYKAFLREAGLE